MPVRGIRERRDVGMRQADRLVRQDRYVLFDQPGQPRRRLGSAAERDHQVRPIVQHCGRIRPRLATALRHKARDGIRIRVPNAGDLRTGLQYAIGVHARVPMTDPENADAHHPSAALQSTRTMQDAAREEDPRDPLRRSRRNSPPAAPRCHADAADRPR